MSKDETTKLGPEALDIAQQDKLVADFDREKLEKKSPASLFLVDALIADTAEMLKGYEGLDAELKTKALKSVQTVIDFLSNQDYFSKNNKVRSFDDSEHIFTRDEKRTDGSPNAFKMNVYPMEGMFNRSIPQEWEGLSVSDLQKVLPKAVAVGRHVIDTAQFYEVRANDITKSFLKANEKSPLVRIIFGAVSGNTFNTSEEIVLELRFSYDQTDGILVTPYLEVNSSNQDDTKDGVLGSENIFKPVVNPETKFPYEVRTGGQANVSKSFSEEMTKRK